MILRDSSRSSVNRGNGGSSVSKGLTHIIGGTIAINLFNFVSVLHTSLF